MLSALRRIVQEALEQCPVSRKPALRRSDDPDALFATDLPMVADNAVVMQFESMLAARGWRISRDGTWLLLDTAVPVPDDQASIITYDEISCCISLLRRHADGPADQRMIRAVVKAAESGRPALERLCGKWHAEWSAALREHQPLPGALLPYLCRAENIMQS